MSDFVHIDRLSFEEQEVIGHLEPAQQEAEDAEQAEKERPKTNPTERPFQLDVKFIRLHPFVRKTVIDKVHGCIVGSALGDTIGLYTEFLPKYACELVYKHRKFSLVEPVTEPYPDQHRSRFAPCAWTDDTDQALLILLAHLHHHSSPEESTDLAQEFASRLQSWIEQGLLCLGRPPCGIGALVGSVVSNRAYLKGPADTAILRWIKTMRHAAPNGSLMRTHPIGVICIGSPEEEAWKIAAAVGRTTHVDPRCVVACCISVGLIRGMLRGEILDENDVNKAIERAYEWVRSQPELMNPGLDEHLSEWEIERHLERREFERHVYAQEYQELKLDSRKEIGYVYKCLGSAILALRLAIRGTAETPVTSNTLFEDLMTDLTMEGGDADTNGAAAGALLGAWLGYSNIPSHWVNGLAHKEWLMAKITRLSKTVGILDGEVEIEDDEALDGGKGFMNKEELEQRDRAMLHQILMKDKDRRERAEREAREKNKGKGLAGFFKYYV